MAPKAELIHLGQVATDQGRPKVAAVCLAAVAYITELEAEIQRIRGNAKQSAQTRLSRTTPAGRRAQAQLAAQRRWSRNADG